MTVARALSGFLVAASLLAPVGRSADKTARQDFPYLDPWREVGAIRLDEKRAEVAHDYDAVGHRYHVQVRGSGFVQGYYILHRSRVFVTFDDGRVNEIDFTTRFYRTSDGF